jgi:hypothetical protein
MARACVGCRRQRPVLGSCALPGDRFEGIELNLEGDVNASAHKVKQTLPQEGVLGQDIWEATGYTFLRILRLLGDSPLRPI